MTELEKACEGNFKRAFPRFAKDIEEKGDLSVYKDHKFCFEIAFRNAQKPEYTKLTDEVQGLIGLLKTMLEYEFGSGCVYSEIEYMKRDMINSLKPFEKEGEND
jgi:hypothetical protein